MRKITRRGFVGTSAALGLGRLLPPLSAQDVQLDPKLVRLDPGIEPLVRLLEDSPRDEIIEEVAARIRKGLTYKELLAALLLAGVRNVQPRPVGFKFHAVLVVHSAHQAAQAAPDADRWLPLLWALDPFKASQAEEKQKTGWRLGPVSESAVPAADKARDAFFAAMDAWDVAAADAAVPALVRNLPPQEVFEVFTRVAARDFRDIGHKVIYVAGAFRTLETIGWPHAEPVLRSVALAMNYYTGDSPAKSDQAADRPGRRARELAPSVPASWAHGKADDGAAAEFYKTLRNADAETAQDAALALLKRGIAAKSLWDAIHPAAGEILMRRAGILSLHALTTMNAMRHCYESSTDEQTRRFLLLQAAAFIPLFRGKIDKELKLDELAPGDGAPSVDDVFADVARDNLSASRKALAYLKGGGDATALTDRARRLIFEKGRDSHDYKFCSAVLEDARRLAGVWRDRHLAASLHHLKGSGSPDNGLVGRIRGALKG
jgi:hypothetical protein